MVFAKRAEISAYWAKTFNNTYFHKFFRKNLSYSKLYPDNKLELTVSNIEGDTAVMRSGQNCPLLGTLINPSIMIRGR